MWIGSFIAGIVMGLALAIIIGRWYGKRKH